MSDTYTIIHGDKWSYKDIEESVEWALKQKWEKKKWSPRAAIVSKGKQSDYVGQKYDPKYSKVDEQGWTHDHCEICWWTIHESDNPEEGIGYTSNDHQWICTECYDKFIVKKA